MGRACEESECSNAALPHDPVCDRHKPFTTKTSFLSQGFPLVDKFIDAMKCIPPEEELVFAQMAYTQALMLRETLCCWQAGHYTDVSFESLDRRTQVIQTLLEKNIKLRDDVVKMHGTLDKKIDVKGWLTRTMTVKSHTLFSMKTESEIKKIDMSVIRGCEAVHSGQFAEFILTIAEKEGDKSYHYRAPCNEERQQWLRVFELYATQNRATNYMSQLSIPAKVQIAQQYHKPYDCFSTKEKTQEFIFATTVATRQRVVKGGNFLRYRFDCQWVRGGGRTKPRLVQVTMGTDPPTIEMFKNGKEEPEISFTPSSLMDYVVSTDKPEVVVCFRLPSKTEVYRRTFAFSSAESVRSFLKCLTNFEAPPTEMRFTYAALVDALGSSLGIKGYMKQAKQTTDASEWAVRMKLADGRSPSLANREKDERLYALSRQHRHSLPNLYETHVRGHVIPGWVSIAHFDELFQSFAGPVGETSMSKGRPRRAPINSPLHQLIQRIYKASRGNKHCRELYKRSKECERESVRLFLIAATLRKFMQGPFMCDCLTLAAHERNDSASEGSIRTSPSKLRGSASASTATTKSSIEKSRQGAGTGRNCRAFFCKAFIRFDGFRRMGIMIRGEIGHWSSLRAMDEGSKDQKDEQDPAFMLQRLALEVIGCHEQASSAAQNCSGSIITAANSPRQHSVASYCRLLNVHGHPIHLQVAKMLYGMFAGLRPQLTKEELVRELDISANIPRLKYLATDTEPSGGNGDLPKLDVRLLSASTSNSSSILHGGLTPTSGLSTDTTLLHPLLTSIGQMTAPALRFTLENMLGSLNVRNYLGLFLDLEPNIDAESPLWRSVFFSLLLQSSRTQADEADEKAVFNLVMGVISTLHYGQMNVASARPRSASNDTAAVDKDIEAPDLLRGDSTMWETLLALHQLTGWTERSAVVFRVMLLTLLAKLKARARNFTENFDWSSKNWEHVRKLMFVVEEFIFYSAWFDENVEGASPRLHITESRLLADLPVVERVVELLQVLKLSHPTADACLAGDNVAAVEAEASVRAWGYADWKFFSEVSQSFENIQTQWTECGEDMEPEELTKTMAPFVAQVSHLLTERHFVRTQGKPKQTMTSLTGKELVRSTVLVFDGLTDEELVPDDIDAPASPREYNLESPMSRTLRELEAGRPNSKQVTFASKSSRSSPNLLRLRSHNQGTKPVVKQTRPLFGGRSAALPSVGLQFSHTTLVFCRTFCSELQTATTTTTTPTTATATTTTTPTAASSSS